MQPGRPLDKLVAVNAAGFVNQGRDVDNARFLPGTGSKQAFKRGDEVLPEVDLPHFSTDNGLAMQVLERVNPAGYTLTKTGANYSFAMTIRGVTYNSTGTSPAHAICEACAQLTP